MADQPRNHQSNLPGPATPGPAPATPLVIRAIPHVLLAAGLVGLAAALALAIEKVAVLADPTHVPNCSISPILNCGSVMSAHQAEAFGFPNPFIGLIGFAVLTTAAVVMLTGAVLPRWFWLGMQVGTTFGVVFVHWLIFQSLYHIQALCPYCLAVWIGTIPAFWYTLIHNVYHHHLKMPRLIRRVAVKYHSTVIAAWYLAIALLILQAFWTYWTTFA